MTIFSYITCLLVAVCLFFELRRDLMMLQQNSYRRERYTRWLNTSGDTTSVSRLLAVAVLFIILCRFETDLIGTVLAIVFAVCRTIKLITAKYKKPLVMTARATRILITDIVLVAAITIFATLSFALTPERMPIVCLTALIAQYCLSHIVTMLANTILHPVELAINRHYYNDAAKRLKTMPELTIIGITGSYGKTSTKHYLHRILSEHYDTLMTPGSYNTTLGVVRTIREHLKPYNQVFIVEMGAKQRGDIAEICHLVNPSIGIVTAVGPQHLESFKTIDNVRDTKFELVDALPSDGLAVINDDFEKIATRPVDNVKATRYAVKNTEHADYKATDIQYSSNGTTFTISGPDGYTLAVETKLVGECNISNLIAAVIVAIRLNVPDSKIQYAISQIEQVEHRLNVKRTPGGLTIIDDAFNSNPTGSAMALDVLAGMNGGRRIVITPGMIELGEQQEELNRQFGNHIARTCDLAYIVGHYNRDAIVAGILDEGFDKDNIMTFDTFADAQRHLTQTFKPGDTVLYENDLPDTFK